MKKILTLILAALMLLGALVPVAADGAPFSDVKEKRWSYDSIVYAYEKGYMDGVGGGKFDPAGTMTRGMVVTVLYRMEGTPEVEFSNVFTDVKSGKYYSKAVIWAKDNEIVNGVSEGKFDPGGKTTREQLATMLYRYAEFKGYDVTASGDLSKFPDADKAHVFDMFYTGENRVADGRRSLGLGLALCRSAVRAHGGEIAVSDNEPRGSVFSFTLPCEEVDYHE
jgi:hypothetical protein